MRVFKTKLRLKAGGAMNLTTGVMTGGVTLGHFMTTVRVNVERTILTSRISAGPTTQDTDDDDMTCTIEIEAATDSVAERNLATHAAAGGYAQITAADGFDLDTLNRHGAFKFGSFGGSGQKEAGTQNTTLVGTNSVLEAEWIAAQADLGGGA